MITSQPLSISAPPQLQIESVAVPVRIEIGRNLEWPLARPWLESQLKLVLAPTNEVTAKERAQAFSEMQTWFVAGPKGGRTAETVPEIDAIGNKLAESDLNTRLRIIGNTQALTMSVAYADGKNGVTAGIEFMRSLKGADREMFFAATIIPDKTGQYAYRSEAEFFERMARLENEWRPPSVGNGRNQTRDEATALATLEAIQAQNKIVLGRLKSEYNNLAGGSRTVTDTIELTGPGAKAAAKTLQTDGTSDVALKALETLKQVGEQQRDWAKSLAEDDATKTLDAALDGTATLATANIAKPGSVLSIAA